jgi:hypothetical protein
MEPNSVSNFIDETALYYTFSTIAQTLAGAFAILAAFVLFKIQSLNECFKNLAKLLGPVANYIGYRSDAGYLEDWGRYIAEFEDVYEKNGKSIQLNINDMRNKDIEMHINTFKKDFKLKKRVSYQVHTTFILTAVTIILSLIFLPLVTTQVGTLIMNIGLVITLILSCICICLYGKILMTALELKTGNKSKKSP